MVFADLELARRLERTEARACAEFAIARLRVDPASDAAWMNCGGATVVFDGIDSPITQTFGLGMFAPVTDVVLDEIEEFFAVRGASVQHEVCPLAGVEALDLLCRRGYRPVEIASVMAQPVWEPQALDGFRIRVREIALEEIPVWSEVSARAWSYGHPELLEFVQGFGGIVAAREHTVSFLAEIDGEPAAAGSLSIDEGVALFAGAATLAEYRRRGLQGALLAERMRYAARAGCDLAMMVAEAGGPSQRNAERNGFRIAYTRVKWKLEARASAS
jgi:GNAT superfamily N-acetyltransferase